MVYNERMNGKEVIKRLQAAGFKLLRTRGSHYIFGNGTRKVTVPVHGAADIHSGTLHNIAKQSGVKLP